jgi:hypothetical protein
MGRQDRNGSGAGSRREDEASPKPTDAESRARDMALGALAAATGASLEALRQADDRASRGFTPMAHYDPELDRTLKRRYAERWLAKVGVPGWTVEDALKTVALEIAAGDEPNEFRLRCRSTYTGATYSLDPWDGSKEEARAFIDDVAVLQAANVQEERADWPSPDATDMP